MAKKKSLVNLSLDTELLEALKKQSAAKGFEKMSDYVADWLNKLALDKGMSSVSFSKSRSAY